MAVTKISIKEVARLLQAMPPTQVSVERLFSALKLQKSDLRNRIKADALDALLLLKASSDHIDKLAESSSLFFLFLCLE